MKEKPILFNTEMVRAILDGRKTVTRRALKPQPINPPSDVGYWDGLRHWGYETDATDTAWVEIEPPYRPSDILWVRETWAPLYADDNSTEAVGYLYKTDPDCQTMEDYDRKYPAGKDWTWEGRWRPSIHMPREAARIWLRVTDVKVERLQEMRAEDSLREGVKLQDRKSTRLNSSHPTTSRMPSSA